MPHMTLTEWLVKRHKQAEDIAGKEASGVAKSALSRFLNGEAMLSPANCGRIVAYTGGKVTLQDLLDEHAERKETREELGA